MRKAMSTRERQESGIQHLTISCRELCQTTLDLQSAPTLDHQSAPTLDLQSAPTLDLQSAPTLDHQSAPTLDLQSAPTLDHQSAPTLHLQSAPTLDLQSAPTLDLQSAPTPTSANQNNRQPQSPLKIPHSPYTISGTRRNETTWIASSLPL